jgi:hypothetical protein
LAKANPVKAITASTVPNNIAFILKLRVVVRDSTTGENALKFPYFATLLLSSPS